MTALESSLPDEMFLTTVDDVVTGATYRTFSVPDTPTILLSFAASRFDDAATSFFKSEFGLGAVDWRVLYMLAREPGVTAARTSAVNGVDKGAVSRSLSKLEAEGLVMAGELHANGRSRGWHLTAKGRQLHDRALTVTLERQRSLLGNFSDEDVRLFCELLRRFLSNVEQALDVI